MDLIEINSRIQQFRHDHCGERLDADVPLRFVASMYWALGLEAPALRLRPRLRQMVAGDIIQPGEPHDH